MGGFASSAGLVVNNTDNAISSHVVETKVREREREIESDSRDFRYVFI